MSCRQAELSSNRELEKIHSKSIELFSKFMREKCYLSSSDIKVDWEKCYLSSWAWRESLKRFTANQLNFFQYWQIYPNIALRASQKIHDMEKWSGLPAVVVESEISHHAFQLHVCCLHISCLQFLKCCLLQLIGALAVAIDYNEVMSAHVQKASAHSFVFTSMHNIFGITTSVSKWNLTQISRTIRR